MNGVKIQTPGWEKISAKPKIKKRLEYEHRKEFLKISKKKTNHSMKMGKMYEQAIRRERIKNSQSTFTKRCHVQ